jgi:hypothetical protein
MQNYNLIQGVHSADLEECVRRARGACCCRWFGAGARGALAVMVLGCGRCFKE